MDLELGIERGKRNQTKQNNDKNKNKTKNITPSQYNLSETWSSMDPSNESSESNRRNAGGMIERYDSGDQSDQRNRAPESQKEGQRERERDFERRKWKIIKERNEKLKTEK